MTITKILIIAIVVIAAIYFVGCQPKKATTKKESTMKTSEKESPTTGRDCAYRDIRGIATITSISQDNPNKVVIKYDFKQLNKVRYEFPKFSDKNIAFFVKGHGSFPPLSWVKAQKMKVGAKYNCIRREITSGACTPVVFAFPEFEKNGWEE